MRHSEVCGILYAPHRNLDGLPFKQLKHPFRSTSFSECFKSNSWACFIVILQLDIRSAPIFFGKAKDSTSCLFRRFSRAFMTTLFNSSQTVPYHMRTTTQSLHNKTFGKNGLDLSYRVKVLPMRQAMPDFRLLCWNLSLLLYCHGKF